MKTFCLGFIAVFLSGSVIQAQSNLEKEIRTLEEKEIKALLSHDFIALEGIWAEDFMVNNPFYTVIKGRSFVFDRMREGIINYSSFTREIEGIMVLDNMVVVMGLETVFPKGNAPMAGQEINRRYTNLWIMEEGKWKIKARHANVICK
jgi:hypothetical protein